MSNLPNSRNAIDQHEDVRVGMSNLAISGDAIDQQQQGDEFTIYNLFSTGFLISNSIFNIFINNFRSQTSPSNPKPLFFFSFFFSFLTSQILIKPLILVNESYVYFLVKLWIIFW